MHRPRSWFLVVAALLLAAPAQAEDAPMQIAGAVTVDAEKVIELIDSRADLVVIDCRKPADFAAGAIEGAVRLIDTEMTEETLAKVVPSKDTPVLFYCNGVKCGRAAKAVEKAVAWGYTKVHYYALGMEEWTRKRLPLIKRS